MKAHLRRWGAIYLLLGLFLGSWIGQFFAELAEFRHDSEARGEPFEWGAFATKFAGSTFENWQSEWLQLLVQGAVLLGMKHLIFRADAADMERLDLKLNALLEKHGVDHQAIDDFVASTPPHDQVEGAGQRPRGGQR